MEVWNDERGQGTVEAAVVIPVLFVLMLMLIQPGIVLYDYIVMRSAAAEMCRLAATTDVNGGEGANSCRDFALNRLSAIPQHDFFHVHDGSCTWFVQVEGGEDDGFVEVWIDNEIRPLPLFDVGMRLLGVTNRAGNLDLSVSVASFEQPNWVLSSTDGSPSEWVGEW